MRTEKELWELVLSRTDLFETGLCAWVRNAVKCEGIGFFEWSLLKRALKTGLPRRDFSLYCWPAFQIKPRIEWIKNRIKQLEDGEL